MPEPKQTQTQTGIENDATQPKGRVIIELSSSGQISMEYYTNGARTKVTLDRNNEWWTVLDTLKSQQRIAQGKKPFPQVEPSPFGSNFILPPPAPKGPPNTEREMKPGISDTDTADRISVCHCGQATPVFWTNKCHDCPGAFGAGKIVRQFSPRGKELPQGKEPSAPSIAMEDLL